MSYDQRISSIKIDREGNKVLFTKGDRFRNRNNDWKLETEYWEVKKYTETLRENGEEELIKRLFIDWNRGYLPFTKNRFDMIFYNLKNKIENEFNGDIDITSIPKDYFFNYYINFKNREKKRYCISFINHNEENVFFKSLRKPSNKRGNIFYSFYASTEFDSYEEAFYIKQLILNYWNYNPQIEEV